MAWHVNQVVAPPPMAIRSHMGRVRAAPGDPRPTSICSTATVIDEPGLTLPHPGMCDRAFVLTPLAEIAPTTR